MTDTVKLRCGECGSEGEFPILPALWRKGESLDVPLRNQHEQREAIYDRWVEVHAPCLGSVARYDGGTAEGRDEMPKKIDQRCPNCVSAGNSEASCIYAHTSAEGVDAAPFCGENLPPGPPDPPAPPFRKVG